MAKMAKTTPRRIRKLRALRGGWQLQNTAKMLARPLQTGVETVTHLPDERMYAHDIPERTFYTLGFDALLFAWCWLRWGERIPRAEQSE